jgi:histidyl-tRNA synthetase
LPLAIRGLPAATLPAGWYIYAGSARGPGGIRARLGRHLGPGKGAHWHIDTLTQAAVARRGFPIPGGEECALVRALLARPGTRIPVPGFGSSDCRSCASHLLAVAQERSPGGDQADPVVVAR